MELKSIVLLVVSIVLTMAFAFVNFHVGHILDSKTKKDIKQLDYILILVTIVAALAILDVVTNFDWVVMLFTFGVILAGVYFFRERRYWRHQYDWSIRVGHLGILMIKDREKGIAFFRDFKGRITCPAEIPKSRSMFDKLEQNVGALVEIKGVLNNRVILRFPAKIYNCGVVHEGLGQGQVAVPGGLINVKMCPYEGGFVNGDIIKARFLSELPLMGHLEVEKV